jgi:hypothetical protein
MTKRTPTEIDRTTKWGLFRLDAEAYDDNTVLQGKWYATELDALTALEILNNSLPLSLKKIVVVKEVPINPADQNKIYNYAKP